MDASVLVDIHNRMGLGPIEKINQMIFRMGEKEMDKNDSKPDAP